MLKSTLFTAIESASVVHCQGYEIDGFVYDLPGLVRLDCGDDTIALFKDQAITIDSDGAATVRMHDGPEAEDLRLVRGIELAVEFKVTIPLRAEDLLVAA